MDAQHIWLIGGLSISLTVGILLFDLLLGFLVITIAIAISNIGEPSGQMRAEQEAVREKLYERIQLERAKRKKAEVEWARRFKKV